MMDTPHVWVGCLGCYNGGSLVGQWFDAINCPTEMTGEGEESFNGRIDDATVSIPGSHYREGHEELWVFDHEGFGGALDGECSPSEAQELVRRVTRYVDAAS